jgi:hypothetical protein
LRQMSERYERTGYRKQRSDEEGEE